MKALTCLALVAVLLLGIIACYLVREVRWREGEREAAEQLRAQEVRARLKQLYREERKDSAMIERLKHREPPLPEKPGALPEIPAAK